MKSILIVAFAILAVSTSYAASTRFLRSVRACAAPDPLEFEGGPINVAIDPLLVINEGSTAGPGVATGLSNLETDVGYNLLTQVVSFKVTLPAVHVKVEAYVATGVIDAKPFRPETIPSGSFEGSGSLEAEAADFEIEGKATLLVNLITNRVSIRAGGLSVSTLKFSGVKVRIEGLKVGGQEIDWDTWNANFENNFVADWTASKAQILETVRVSVNQELKNYTLAQLLEIILKPPTTCPPERKK